MNSKKRPLGLSAELAASKAKELKEPHVIGEWVLWLEQRPTEGGRTTALIRRFGNPKQVPQELTEKPINLRSRIHGYGGGVLAQAKKGNELIITWVDDQDGCIWKQSWLGLLDTNQNKSNNWLCKKGHALRLSKPSNISLAGGVITLTENLWLGIMEKDGKDFIVSLSLDKENQTPNIIHEPKDFAGYLALSPKEDQLVWVEWQRPLMPWDASQLWLGELNNSEVITNKKFLKGTHSNEAHKISVFQPIWTGDHEILISEDSSGWWNLIKSNSDQVKKEYSNWTSLSPMEAETAMPQWVNGMRTTAIANNGILVLVCQEGQWHIKLINKNGTVSNIEQPFNDISGLNSQEEKAVAIAKGRKTSVGLLEIDLRNKTWTHTPASDAFLEESQISVAEPFWFKGFNKEQTHAWYYPPIGNSKKASPLLVKSHSGPTGMATCGFDLNIQFWTSKGWGVVDVNYGGSTGFGRRYRERLNNKWGLVDVFDCISAVKALIELGKANEELIAIEGGSAGGFTTLSCLCSSKLFKAAACRYAVSDLVSLANNTTHRFEETYLDNLIGEWPKKKKIYEERSPLLNVNQINCPIIFFQGLKDHVVTPEQTFQMAEALKANKIPIEVYKFPKEGHGFKDGNVKIKVLKETEKFFNKHLGL